MTNPIVKICGITNVEDANLAVSEGATALGFIFADSPRQVNTSMVKRIIKQLPPFITCVGVFVDETVETVNRICDECSLDLVQLHGKETPVSCTQHNRKVIKAIRISTQRDLELIDYYKNYVSSILLDTYVENIPGGTGQTFDWKIAKEALKKEMPIILSGGLTPENVSSAIKEATPYAIDINSGIESSPGKKDPQKTKALFNELNKITI
jgi:phosphoribosylanthranilate isomerase